MSFDGLPVELYGAILDLVPSPELQATALSVTRAIPSSPVPQHYIFKSIRLTYPHQAVSLYRRLRLRPHSGKAEDNGRESFPEVEAIANWVEELSIESWDIDAEIVINIVRLLGMPKLRSLTIWIGPSNFAPEHLEEIFSKPFPSLQQLSLRFRPYVRKATYYQFLKGAYFDSTLSALRGWPSSCLQFLSIVQDPLDSAFFQTEKRSFAQPIVFFRFDITSLLTSPSLSLSLKALRLRIPSRPILRSLHNTHEFLASDLEFLDLSTSGVLESEIDILLVRFASLKHIVLDDCAIMHGDSHDRIWHALGKRMALVGVKRAKEREKEIKAWRESRNASALVDNQEGHRRAKRGRKGLATATISLRNASRDAYTFNSEKKPQQKTPQEDGQVPKGSSKRSAKKPGAAAKKFDIAAKKPDTAYSKIRILPSLPSLLSLSFTPSSASEPARRPIIQAEFKEGWAEGIAQLAVTRARLRTSAGNGYCVMRVSSVDRDNLSVSQESMSIEDGLEDLEEVDRLDPDSFGMPEGEDGKPYMPAPVLCQSKEGLHEENCGHKVGWDVMKDEI